MLTSTIRVEAQTLFQPYAYTQGWTWNLTVLTDDNGIPLHGNYFRPQSIGKEIYLSNSVFQGSEGTYDLVLMTPYQYPSISNHLTRLTQ